MIPGNDPILLTPGPLSTSPQTREAMLRDWGSWDGDFRAMTAQLRASLLEIAGDKSGAIAHYKLAAERTSSLPERNYLVTQVARLSNGAI